MTFTELLSRQIAQGKDLMSRIEALREIPQSKNDFGDGMAVFTMPSRVSKFDERDTRPLSSELHKWQNVTHDILRQGLPTDSPYIEQFKESISDKRYVYNAQRGLRNELTKCLDVLESVTESIALDVAGTKTPAMKEEGTVKVFISHASKDIAFIKPFQEIILKQALGLRDEEIACTSFESTGVAPGYSIPQYIKEKIDCAKVCLSMVSSNYKASEVCLNEVGAAFALETPIIQVVLPGVTFDKLGWLLHLDKAAKLDDGDSLDHLAESICNKLGITMPTPRHWNPSRASFLEAIAKATEDTTNLINPVYSVSKIVHR